MLWNEKGSLLEHFRLNDTRYTCIIIIFSPSWLFKASTENKNKKTSTLLLLCYSSSLIKQHLYALHEMYRQTPVHTVVLMHINKNQQALLKD